MNSDRFSYMWSQPARELIATVTKNLTRVDHAVTIIHQFYLHTRIHVRYMLSFFSKKKGRSHPYSQTTHPITLPVSLYQCTITHQQFLFARSTSHHTRQFPSIDPFSFPTTDSYAWKSEADTIQMLLISTTPMLLTWNVSFFFVCSDKSYQECSTIWRILIHEFLSTTDWCLRWELEPNSRFLSLATKSSLKSLA